MKTNKLLIGTLLAAGLLTSCAKEDLLTAQPDTLTDAFAPAPDAMDEESVLRRAFYESEHSYLLFNDTLRYDSISVAPNGKTNYRIELLDLDYTIGQDKNAASKNYIYTYLTTLEEKQAAVELLRTGITSKLPQNMRPFSWFVLSKVKDGRKYPLYINKQRATALAMSTLMSQTDEARTQSCNEIVASIIALRLPAAEATDFYQVSKDFYNTRIGYNMDDIHAAGFIVKGLYGKAPTQDADLMSYFMLFFDKSLAEIGSDPELQPFPLVQKKARLVHDLCVKYKIAIKE